MKRITLIGSLLLATAAPAAAEDAREADVRPTLVTVSEEEARALPPLLYDIRGVLLERESEVAALEAALADASTPEAVRDLERRIAAAKEQAEVRIYRLQAAHARQEGREAEAVRYEELARAHGKPARVEEVPSVAPREEAGR